MPRYYCDYCDTYLTHDSPSVRKQHNSGYKHKANIRAYYQKFEEQQTQTLIDQKIKEHLGQAAVYQQIGAAYNQHLAAFPGARPRLPVMPMPLPMLHIQGAVAPQFHAGIRPPILPVPVPGYASVPMVQMQPPPASSFPLQTSGHPTPPSTSGPSPVARDSPAPSSTAVSPAVPPAATQFYGIAPSAATSTAGGYSYPQSSQSSN